jgi:hypothetical protein
MSMEHTRYHEVIQPTKELLESIANGVGRLLVGNYPPTKVNLNLTTPNRWTDMGEYLERE